MPEKARSRARPLTRGAVAARTGVNIETVRYYERIGLLPPPPRTAGGHRIYGEELLKRLTFIRRSRDLGFTLDEIRGLLRLVDGGDYTCADIARLIGRPKSGHTYNQIRATIESVPLIGGLFWSSAMKEGAIASLVLGTGAFFLFEFAVSPFVGLHPGVLGMMTGTLALVLVSKTTARRVGSNLQPPDSKSGALSVELRVRPTRVTRSMARRPGASGCPSESHKTDRSGT